MCVCVCCVCVNATESPPPKVGDSTPGDTRGWRLRCGVLFAGPSPLLLHPHTHTQTHTHTLSCTCLRVFSFKSEVVKQLADQQFLFDAQSEDTYRNVCQNAMRLHGMPPPTSCLPSALGTPQTARVG